MAGLGTRLLPATKSQPKEMLPVGRKPVVQYVVEELARVGLDRILFITGPGKTSIENHFDRNHELIENLREGGKEDLLAELDFERAAVQYFFTRQRELLGLGHAVLCAEAFIGREPFVVALGDSIIGMRAERRGRTHGRRLRCCAGAAAVIAFEEVSWRRRSPTTASPLRPTTNLSTAATSSAWPIWWRNRMRPALTTWPSPRATCWRRTSSARCGRRRRARGGEIQLTDAIRLLLREGGPVYGVRLQPHERRYDIGNFGAYFRAFVEFALADDRQGAELRRYLEELLRGDHP
ncbi:MAG: sugar phosphate nucleotidyltransferase [Caldilineaceae bacterium]